MPERLTAEREQFVLDGYVFVPTLLSREETELFLNAAKFDHLLLDSAFDVKDTRGNNCKLSFWNHPGHDIDGVVSRSQHIVDRMEAFLGGKVYHFHSKIMLKEPHMASCLSALDLATKANGSLPRSVEGSDDWNQEESAWIDQLGVVWITSDKRALKSFL